MAIKIIWGVPGAGKTYYTVRKLLKSMGKNRKEHYFTNFPVEHPKKGFTDVWKSELAKQNITDSMIVIDEAYRNYNSRDYKKFQHDEHTFFATNRHLNNDIFLIAHNPARIDVVIREITEEFILMHCHKVPLLGWPLWFSADVFLDELAVAQRYTSPHAIYCVERFPFNRTVGNAYDTHFYRSPDIDQIQFENWADVLNIEDDPEDDTTQKPEEAILCST